MTRNELLGMDDEGNFVDDDDGDGPLHPEHQKIIDDSHRLRAICENPKCTNVMWKKEEDANMSQCSKCKAARYCSVSIYIAAYLCFLYASTAPMSEVRLASAQTDMHFVRGACRGRR